ncbi:28490_t:CDS:1, partial [Dentiscutata erythropus]
MFSNVYEIRSNAVTVLYIIFSFYVPRILFNFILSCISQTTSGIYFFCQYRQLFILILETSLDRPLSPCELVILENFRPGIDTIVYDHYDNYDIRNCCGIHPTD